MKCCLAQVGAGQDFKFWVWGRMKCYVDVTTQNGSYWVVLSCGTPCCAQYKVVLYLELEFVDNILCCIQKKATVQYSLVAQFTILYKVPKVVLT